MEFLLLCIILSFFRFSEVSGTNYPGNLTCTALNSTVLQVNWDQATDTSVAGYHLDVERVDGLRIEFGLPSIDLNHISYETYTFYGLGKFGTYNITVHSYFTSGANGTDYVVSCQTSSDVPDASNFNLTCGGISTSEISCTWNALSAVYWNGIPQGYEIRYIGFVNDYYKAVNLSTSDLAYTISGLGFDSWYIIQLRTISDAGYSPYTSDHAKTHGWPDTTENKTRYYCYETIPGRLTWEWEEMPCTVYVGIILAFMLLSLIFMVLSCLMCCCKGKGDTKNNVAVNIFNEEGNDDERDLYYDDDDDDDDYEESHRDYSDDDDDDFNYDSEGNPTDTAKADKKKRKMAEAYGEAGLDDTEEDLSDEESISEEEPEYETSEVETEPDEEYDTSEGDDEINEEEKIAKKEKKLAAIAAAKEMRERKREEKAKRKADKDAERAEQKAKKDQERVERKAKKDQERAERNARREEEKAKLKAAREEKMKEVAMRKAERKERAKQKAEQNQKNKSDTKSKKVEENEKNDSEEESENETSEYDSEDYDSVEDSNSGDTEREVYAKEQKLENKTKTNLKMKTNRKKTLAGKAVLSTINENRRYKKKNKLNEKQPDTKYKNKSRKNVNLNKYNDKENVKDKQNENKIQSDKKNTRKLGKQFDGSDESYDDSDVEYYEDWDPDAENNPKTNVTLVNANDRNLNSENSKALQNSSKSSHSKSKGNDKDNKIDKNKNDNESGLASREKRAIAKENDKNKTSQDENSDDSDGYDSDDEDYDSDAYTNSSDESNGENLKSKGNQNIKNRVSIQSDKRKANNLSDDSGRGSVTSFDWEDSNNKGMIKSDFQSNKKDTKTGFFGGLFGKSTKTSVMKDYPVEKNRNSVLKLNDDTIKTSTTNDWDSDDDDAANTGNNSLHSKQENKSTNWQGNSISNLNNNRNINNNGYLSTKMLNTGNAMSNSNTASRYTKTDFGDWGRDDNDNKSEHSQQYRQNPQGYSLSQKNRSTAKNVGVSGLNSSSDFIQRNGDYNPWPQNRGSLYNKDNNYTDRTAEVQAASKHLNQNGQNYSLGIYENSNGQVFAQCGNGNFGSADQNGQFVNNNYASNLDGQFGQAGNMIDMKGHERKNNKQLPMVYQNPSHNGQTNAIYNTVDTNGESWPINAEFGNNWNKNTISEKVPRGDQFYSNDGTYIQNSQLGSDNTYVQQNGQYRTGKGTYPENSNYNIIASGSIPKNGDYNITASGGIPENGHNMTTASDTILQNEQTTLGSTSANQNRNLATISRNPAFGANNRFQTQNTQFSPMKDLSVHKKSFAVAENRTNSPSNTHDRFSNGVNGTDNSSGTANESSNLGHWQQVTDNQNKSRKLVSFRTNPAFSFGDAGKNPGIISATSRQQGPNPDTNGDGSRPPGNQTFIMPDADIVLPHTETSKRSLSPVGKFIVNKPAWGNTKSNTPNSVRPKGSKTPVEDLLKRHKRMSLTEPEPVLTTDRLAKKFPFLSTVELDKAKVKEDNKSIDHESSMRKNKSDSSLPTFFGRGNLFQKSNRNEAGKSNTENSKDASKLPSTDKSDKDGATLNTETRDKVFYGFGVGKWRWAAAKWLNMWKMKRRPVKTAKSSWD